MEASAFPRPAGLPRTQLSVAAPLLALRSDEQLVALFRAGSEDAFRTIHDRYRARLLAYARQMLGSSSADAEDALQDVFVRVYSSLRTNTRPISLRAWLYRIAHNRCVDEIRRPRAVPSEIHPAAELALSRGARHDPPVEAERQEDIARLLADVRALPQQQRSVLLMRELQGLSYEELGTALQISIPAVKSLLLRARTGLVDATLAREVACEEIQLELLRAHRRSVRSSGRARRHMRECSDCKEFRGQLGAVRRNIAALAPAGPHGHLSLLWGIGGGATSAGAGGGLASAGGGTAAAVGGAAASKVAAIVCCAALLGTAGTALHHEVRPAHHVAAPTLRRAGPSPTPPAVPQAALAQSRRSAPAVPFPARRRAASGHAHALRAGGRAHKPAAQPLTGQDMVYDTGPGVASGADPALGPPASSAVGAPPVAPAASAGAAAPASTATPSSPADGPSGASAPATLSATAAASAIPPPGR